MKPLRLLTPADALAEIRRLYFQTSRRTIQQDFAKAVDLVKSIGDEDERGRATVYMEGLAEMRKDWLRPQRPRQPKAGK